jgi:hypothetical protein
MYDPSRVQETRDRRVSSLFRPGFNACPMNRLVSFHLNVF